MLWVLVDVAIGLLGLLVLGLVAFTLYKRVRVLLRAVGDASAQVGELSAGLSVTPPPGRSAG